MKGYARVLRIVWAGAWTLLLATALPRHGAGADEVTVFAAASLKNVLEDAARDWASVDGVRVRFSFAGSSRLARQIQHGAPADVFISANSAWMDQLARRKLIDPTSRRDLFANRLVLIAHGGTSSQFDLRTRAAWTGISQHDRIAMAMVNSVPAGIYGKRALKALGAWDLVAGRIVQTDNVRAALVLVARGEAALGIVYATDARASRDVSIAGTFPAKAHGPITYPAAVIADSRNVRAGSAFIAYLMSARGRALIAKHGFLLPHEAGDGAKVPAQ